MSTPPAAIQLAHSAVVQVATSESVGAGVVWLAQGGIVTSQQLVEQAPEVIVSGGQSFPPQLVPVLYTDEALDLALIALPQVSHSPKGMALPALAAATTPPAPGSTVWTAVPQPKAGQLTDTQHTFFDIDYLATDLPVNTAHIGSPLLDAEGCVLGLHVGLLQSAAPQQAGYALPLHYIEESLGLYRASGAQYATRCVNCRKVVTAAEATTQCPHCAAEIQQPHLVVPYTPEGVSVAIESLIERAGFNPAVTRRGPNSWALQRGSATITLSYYEPKGYITGDAFLCRLPTDEAAVARIYEFLMRQNYQSEGITFSVHEGDIVLSLVIYDQHLHNDIAHDLLQRLMQQADDYDNILVEQYGASWR